MPMERDVKRKSGFSLGLALVLGAGHAIGVFAALGPACVAMAQDVGAPAGAVGEPAGSEDDYVTLDAFAEGVELTALLEYLVHTLGINVNVDPALTGTVMLNAPIRVHKDDLLGLANSLLEQQGFGMTRDATGFYSVMRIEQLPSTFDIDAGLLATTRILATPNILPSELKGPIEAILRGRSGQQGGGGQQGRVSYLDDLGVVVITDSPGNVRAVSTLIEQIRTERARVEYTRLELKHLSAPVARERAIALVGQESQSGTQRFNVDPNNPGGSPRMLDNIGQRLSVDPLGNALIFRGRPDEVAQVRSLLSVIDTTNRLIPKQYFTGSATLDIAQFAKRRGLGEVSRLESGMDNQFGNQFGGGGGFMIDPNTGQMVSSNQQTVGGSVLVADEYKGQIVYFATPEQHEQLAALIKEFDTDSERIVIREFKLHHANAETVAEILQGLLQNSAPAADSPLLSTGTGQFAQNRTNRQRNFRNQTQNIVGGEADSLTIDPELAFVIADIDNNQVLVKAPAAQQEDFRRIIQKLDLRRPQVYIEATIVAITASDSLRLAFETQLINANGTGGIFNTNFGLGTTSSQIDPKTVATGLLGATAAVIKSDQVPIIINAIASVSDTRILSTPQVLVNDNEEASIKSIRGEPTTTTSLGGGDGGTRDTTTFSGYEEAGTTLTVTPRISEGGYLRLDYSVILSSFDGVGTNGIPPPRLENEVASSASLPTDSTIVVGGIEVGTRNKTVRKVPLLGDIPLVGHLFRDTSKAENSTRLYVFITPKILGDPTFSDLRLITRGPQTAAEIDPDLPPMVPTMIPLIESRPSVPTTGGDGVGTGAAGGN